MTCENHDVTTIDPDTSFEDDDLKLQKTQSEGSTPRKMGVEERQQILILNPDFITLRSGLLEEEKFTPRSKIIALCLMFSILMFLNIMIGGGAFPSPWGIRCGSVAFWVVQVIMVAFLVSSAWAAQTYLVNRHEMKEIVRFDYVHGDIKWDARSAIIYPALFICAGTFAGLFGIGGGMVTVPLMLAMGVHPAVVSATSSAMILFTSFASASSYLVFGLILYDYAIVCFVVGFFASLFGNKVMRQARQAKSANGRNFERNSYIAFCIGGVILVSSLLMTIDYVFRVYAFDDVDYPEGLCEGYRI
ncbi:Sulfite exporter TauE/SafE family protein [Seminavis robusta]|nr:Sulfite exporter TauE/SafE family protein [Seminavis robusta]|eukprot:Sro2258_g321110.1 Sulfite exporter TauE/SafE family protein (303) ;mRNA; r:10863-11771